MLAKHVIYTEVLNHELSRFGRETILSLLGGCIIAIEFMARVIRGWILGRNVPESFRFRETTLT